MTRKIFLIFCFIYLAVKVLSGQSKESGTIIHEFNLKFAFNQKIISRDYLNNDNELIKIANYINTKLDSINNGYIKVSLKSIIYEDQGSNILAINRSAVLASVVRAYLKTKYGLINENFVFGIELSPKGSDSVNIKFIPSSLQNSSMSSEIFYSLSSSKRNIEDQLSKYSKLPFVCEERVIEPKTKSKELPKINFYLLNSMNYKQNNSIKFNSTKSIENKTRYLRPIIGLNTNIIKWIGLSHQWQDRVVVPNIELELFFGNRSAITFSGELRSAKIFNNTSTTNWSYQSGVSVGYKMYFSKKDKFKGLYSTLFFSYRDFDRFNKEKSDSGLTGDALDLGIEFGYNFRITNHIGLIAGVRSCVTHESSSKYIINNNEYYLSSKIIENKLGNSNYFLSLQLRFGK